jgi:hypothetical protein
MQGCIFVRKNILKQMRLKRHFKLCSLRIGSYNINTMPRITKLTQILFMISSKQKSMMSLLSEIITSVLLVLLPCQRFTIMWRILKEVMGLTTIKRNPVNSRRANAMTKTRRTKPKVKGKARYLHAINVVVQTTLLESVEPPKHLVELYQRSLKESNNNKRSYEAHFNDVTKEATTSGTIPSNPKMPKLTDNDDIDMENTIIEYNSNDVFGGLK